MHSTLKTVLINCILASLLADKPVSITGVPSERLHLYQPKEGNKFHCLNDSTKVFDFSVVNDDYCDCEDGSDEPGTSACPNTYFYCNNEGYKPTYIYSSRVNDSVCDCCDGSDEYDGKGSCVNNCADLAKVERVEEERKAKIFSEGSSKRQTYIQQYASIREKALKEVETLTKKVEEAKAKVEELRQIKEAKEKEESDAKASQETQEKSIKENDQELINKIEDLKEVASNLQDDIKHLQSVLDDLKQNHNQNYHDMAVKGAITAYDEFSENFNEIDFHSDPRFHVEKVQEPVNQEQSEDVSQARNQLWDAESSLRDIESDLEKASKTVNMDYGPDGSFAALNDKCVDLVLGEYTYSVCMFGEAHQKSNRENISLGRFEKWDGVSYGEQLYSGGTYCWNGPQRSARVFIECGVEEKIHDVIEPEKCVYHMFMTTPAACFNSQPQQETQKVETDEKDEL